MTYAFIVLLRSVFSSQLIRETWGSTAWWLPAVPSAGGSSDPQETIQNMQLQQGEVGPEEKEEVQSTPSLWWMFGILSLLCRGREREVMHDINSVM